MLWEGHFEKKNIVIERALINGKSTYSFFTYKDLMKLKKRMGDQKFSTQMMNEPVVASDKLFLPPYPLYETLPESRKYYISVDPAFTTKRHSDEAGIAIGCVDKTNPSKVFFVEAYGVKMTPDKLADHIVEKIVTYRPKRVGVETGLQVTLLYLIDLKINEWEGIHGEYIHPEFVPIPTGKTPKPEKLNRTIGAMVKDNRALFPGEMLNGTLVPRKDMQKLFRQMDFYNPNSDKNEDDVLDATGMMIQTIEHFAPAHWFRYDKGEVSYAMTLESLMGAEPNKKDSWGWQFSV